MVGVVTAVNDEVHVATDAAVQGNGELAGFGGVGVHRQVGSGGEDPEVGKLPAVERQVGQLLLAHHRTHRWGGGHQGNCGGYRDLFGHRGHLQRHVLGKGGGHVDHHVFHGQRGEACQLKAEGIGPHGKSGEAVATVAAGDALTANASLHVGGHHANAGKHASLLVHHSAGEGPAARLRQKWGRCTQKHD